MDDQYLEFIRQLRVEFKITASIAKEGGDDKRHDYYKAMSKGAEHCIDAYKELKKIERTNTEKNDEEERCVSVSYE